MTSYEIFQQRTIKAVQTCHDFLRLTQVANHFCFSVVFIFVYCSTDMQVPKYL